MIGGRNRPWFDISLPVLFVVACVALYNCICNEEHRHSCSNVSFSVVVDIWFGRIILPVCDRCPCICGCASIFLNRECTVNYPGNPLDGDENTGFRSTEFPINQHAGRRVPRLNLLIIQVWNNAQMNQDINKEEWFMLQTYAHIMCPVIKQ